MDLVTVFRFKHRTICDDAKLLSREEPVALVAAQAAQIAALLAENALLKARLAKGWECRYSVPAEWIGKVVSVRISADMIRVVAGGELVARHERQFGRNQLICEPWHYLSILETKPGALRHGLPFTNCKLPAAVEAVCIHALKQAKGDLAFAELLLVARETGLEALDVACQLAQEQGHLNTSVVLNELRRLISPSRVGTMATPDALALLLEPKANCARYDELRKLATVEVVHV